MMLRLFNGLMVLLGVAWLPLAQGAGDSTAMPDTVVLSTSLTPETDIVPGQRVRLRLTVATPRWFTGGTRLRLPEVPDLLVLQNQRFASNSTEQRAGQTWSVQRWTVDLFATRPGRYVIPPIQVLTTISIAPGVDREQQLASSPIALTVTLPPALAELDHWVASPEVSFSSNLDDTALSVPLGDAIERRITLKATDVMAMMLPAIEATASPGLQHYAQPPQLRNRANRGQLLAERAQPITWIATESGTAQLPAAEVHWWHTKRKELITLRLPAIDIEITGMPEKHQQGLFQAMGQAVNLPAMLMALTACLAVIAIYRWRHRLRRLAQRGLSLLVATGRWLQRLKDPALPTKLNPAGSPGRSSAVPSREP